MLATAALPFNSSLTVDTTDGFAATSVVLVTATYHICTASEAVRCKVGDVIRSCLGVPRVVVVCNMTSGMFHSPVKRGSLNPFDQIPLSALVDCHRDRFSYGRVQSRPPRPRGAGSTIGPSQEIYASVRGYQERRAQ